MMHYESCAPIVELKAGQPISELPPADALSPQDASTLEGLVDTLAREFSTTDILIGWREPGAAARPLFFTGSDENRSQLEGCLLTAHIAGENATHWTTFDRSDGEADAVMTTSVGVQGQSSAITVTALFKRIGSTTRAHARGASARIVPLLNSFSQLWRSHRSLSIRLEALTSAVNQNDFAVMLVSRSGVVQFTNTAADTLLAQGDGLRLNGSSLAARRLVDTLRLQATIEHVACGGRSAEGARVPVVAIRRTARRPLMIAVLPSEGGQGANDMDGAVIVNVFDPEYDLRRLVEPVCRYYGLSPVETKLACLLADGTCLAEAATAMRVREHSARSYLKQVFLKTDTNRQADLVRLLLKSSVRSVQACEAQLM